MSRFAMFIVLFFCIALAFAAPQQGNATVEELDKRITHVGRGTWYNPSDGEGNCGYWDSDSSPVVAISLGRYDDNNGANCNQASSLFLRRVWIEITNTANGKVAYGKTRDSCVSCGSSDLDMSPSLFKEISTLATGEITISWHFMAMGWSP
ncbi:RlpA-like double-psi beta-barrel-protein domain-containing protein-containing protein [Mycena sanguinolenta]|nr:RlpA-like double-psi beta-barrel-protein domain-containing protein-containing protein [Mycena sanguinolenta]